MKSLLNCALLTFLFCSHLASAKNERNLNLDAIPNDSIDINQFLSIAVDTAGVWSIEDVIGLDENQFSSETPDYKRTNVYWGKMTLVNELDRASLRFLYVGKNDLIDAYFVENGRLVYHTKSGYLYPAEEKDVPKGSYYLPIQLSGRSTQDLYIRIEEKIHRDPEFKLALYDGKQWVVKILDKHILDFIFQGVFWIILIYNFFMYATSKIRAYLYYSVYIFCVSVTYLFLTDVLREYLLKSMPILTIYFIPSTFLVLSSYWLFLRKFLSARSHFILYERGMRALIGVNAALFLGSEIYIGLTQDIYLPSDLSRFAVFVNCLLVFGLMYRIKNSKNEMAKYFIAGTSILMVFAMVDAVLWDPSYSQGVLVKYGLLAEIVLFSLGLAYQKKVKEKARANALDLQIDQLKVNENLAQWQKEELEKIIDSRTKKINKKNKKLKKAIKKANEAARVKSEFLSVMSHEIRTPMNAVIGTIHLLLDEESTPAQLEFLKTLKFSSENLLILINDILDYSKVESGNVGLENIDFDLRQMTKGLSDAFEAKATSNGVGFNILIDQKVPSLLKGDPARLTQILNNLISNAIKFTPQGQVKLFINLLAKSNGRVKLEFCVEDSGIGISKENLRKIFKSFTQAQTDTTRKYGGTGLGLAITKKLIKLFDSHIFVESEENKGSKFSFSLYMEEVAHAQVTLLQDNSALIAGVTGKRVLVVDDNQINLLMAKRFLEKWGMNCTTVLSGKEALEQVLSVDFDIILMDLQMPGMDGYETTATIRSLDSSISSVPIVAVSADTFDNVRFRLAEVGIDDFLSKPFNPNELLKLVHPYTCGQNQTSNI